MMEKLNRMKEEGLPSEEIEAAAQDANNAHCALNSRQRIKAARLTGDICHQTPDNERQRRDNVVHPTASGRGVQRSTPEQQALISREPSMALMSGQGIPDQLNNNAKLYDSITRIIRVVLDDSIDMDPEKSMLAKVGMKLAHPETYLGGSDLEEFEVFVAGILR